MTLDYYYKDQLDKFNFIRIPKTMVTTYKFNGLTMNARFLYGLCLDKMTMSQNNRWIDKEGRVYIMYPIAEIEADLNISKTTAINLVKELEDYGLVEKHKVGPGIPTVLYIKNFAEPA